MVYIIGRKFKGFTILNNRESIVDLKHYNVDVRKIGDSPSTSGNLVMLIRYEKDNSELVEV